MAPVKGIPAMRDQESTFPLAGASGVADGRPMSPFIGHRLGSGHAIETVQGNHWGYMPAQAFRAILVVALLCGCGPVRSQSTGQSQSGLSSGSDSAEAVGEQQPNRPVGTDAWVWIQPSMPSGRASNGPGANRDEDFRWFPDPIRRLRVQIIRFDARRLEYVQSPDQPDTNVVAADRVVWAMPTRWQPGQRQAIDALIRGDDDMALRGLLQQTEKRPAVWLQQWMSMAAAQAASRSGRSEIALEIVRQLDRRPMPPMVVGWLPVCWLSSSGRAGGIDAQAARAALSDPSDAVRLVAASALLEKDRAAASAVLARLSGGQQRPLIAALASAQQMRTLNPAQWAEDWAIHLRRVETLPLAIQMGPLSMAAERTDRAGLDSAAEDLETSLRWAPVAPHPARPETLQMLVRGEPEGP
ncbi:hypothetical protein V7x_47740 [Crateriforma conspicua]|uniref:Uncharacterized protein n=2 Tax=Planctomycetaceae TaxID=126 RepID=A0A5C6FLW6_9PLAN|nr:hypothetical protein V7x_47740 [Crateriforma conspicua]